MVHKDYINQSQNEEALESYNLRLENCPLEEEIVLTQPTYGSMDGWGLADAGPY